MAASTVGVSGVIWTDQRDWYPEPNNVARLHPNYAPFISDLFAMGASPVTDVDYKMFQKEPTFINQYLRINNGSNEAWDAGGTPTDTNACAVDGAVGISVDDSLKGRTVEIWSSDQATFRGIARVKTVTDSTNIVLESVGNPDSATQAIATLQDDDYLFVNGSAFGETSESPEAFSTSPSTVWNSLQHFRTSLELSFDLINTALRGVEGGGSRLSEEQTDKLNEHKIQLERACTTGYRRGGIGGVAYGADSSGATSDSWDATHIPNDSEGRVRTTMGLMTAIRRYGIRDDASDDQSYFIRAKASLDFGQFVEDTAKIFYHTDPATAGERDAYCGPDAYSFWTMFVLENLGANIQISDSKIDGKVGYHYRVLETPHGVLRLIKMPDWRGRYANHMLLPLKKYLKLRVMQGSGNADDPGMMGYFPNIKKDNRPLVRKDEYHSHVGLDIRQIKTQMLYILT